MNHTFTKEAVQEIDLTIFPVQTQYSKVCGKAIAYQYDRPDGFGPARFTPGIDETYVDGISLTYGSPRKHIWSFAAVLHNIKSSHTCPCMDPVVNFEGIQVKDAKRRKQ